MKNYLKNIVLGSLALVAFANTALEASEQELVSGKIDRLVEQFNKINAGNESKWVASLKDELSMVENPKLLLADHTQGRLNELSISGSRVAGQGRQRTYASRKAQVLEETLGESEATIKAELAKLEAREKLRKELIKRTAKITRIYTAALRDLQK